LGEKQLLRKGITVGILFLFLLVSIVPFIHGTANDEPQDDWFTVNKGYDQYMTDWSVHLTNQTIEKEDSTPVCRYEMSGDHENQIETSGSLDGPMDSPWPMLSHDVKHTGRSQYSTINNLGAELWRVRGDVAGAVESSAVIDNNGIIYFGTMGGDHSLYALYPNGTRKWKYVTDDIIWCTPAIADDGTTCIIFKWNEKMVFYPVEFIEIFSRDWR